MAIEEEYLDNLLKSITENEKQPEVPVEAEEPKEDDIRHMIEEIPEEVPHLSEAVLPEERVVFEPTEDWQSGLDDLLAQADVQAEKLTDGESIPDEMSLSDAMDVTDMIDHMDNSDADLEELSGLLKKADSNESTEDDMLALLESVKDDQADGEYDGSGEAFDIFAQVGSDGNAFEEAEKENKRKKKLFSKEKEPKKEKKKKTFDKKTPVKEEETKESDDVVEAATEENSKRPGFFSRMMTYLTQEEEELEGASGENAEIMQELNEEDQQEKKKKKKGKKDKKKKEQEQQTPEEGEEGGEEQEAEGGKKKKKKKEKKEKPPKEEQEKSVKILGRRNLLVLVSACATLIASICVLSTFLPEYADKRSARQAFYEGDYEEVYRLLYDKNLNSSDTVVFERAKTVLTIERKLKSYQNNLAMDRDLEALDALLNGVRCYQELSGVDEYGVRGEVDAIYDQICTVLQSEYGITVSEAIEINAYDNDTYTRKLNSVVNGTDFSLPGEGSIEEDPMPKDVLPEEEDIISY